MKIKEKLIEEIVEISHLIYKKGFVSSTDGNISAKLPNGNILCTPTSVNKGEVKKSHIVEVNPMGEVVYGIYKPSTDLPEVIVNLGKIPLAKYATPSTEEVPLSIEPFKIMARLRSAQA
jgi:L-fuculose-phosphate aldolase